MRYGLLILGVFLLVLVSSGRIEGIQVLTQEEKTTTAPIVDPTTETKVKVEETSPYLNLTNVTCVCINWVNATEWDSDGSEDGALVNFHVKGNNGTIIGVDYVFYAKLYDKIYVSNSTDRYDKRLLMVWKIPVTKEEVDEQGYEKKLGYYYKETFPEDGDPIIYGDEIISIDQWSERGILTLTFETHQGNYSTGGSNGFKLL